MNLFNRILIILVILAVMILIPLALILPEQTEFVLSYAAQLIRLNLDWLNTLAATEQILVRLVLAVVALIVFVIGLLLLILEVIRIRRSTVKLKDGSGELMTDSVGGHLAYSIDQLPDVIRVKPTVQSKGKSVRASLYVETGPGVNVPQKSAQIAETARQVIEEQLGLRISKEIKVVIKPVPYPQARRGRWSASRPGPRPARAQPERREPPPPLPVEPPPPPPVEAPAPREALLEDFEPPAEAVESLPQEADEDRAEENELAEFKGPSS